MCHLIFFKLKNLILITFYLKVACYNDYNDDQKADNQMANSDKKSDENDSYVS